MKYTYKERMDILQWAREDTKTQILEHYDEDHIRMRRRIAKLEHLVEMLLVAIDVPNEKLKEFITRD